MVSGSGIQGGLAGQFWLQVSHLAIVRWGRESEQPGSKAAEGWLGISPNAVSPLRAVCVLLPQDSQTVTWWPQVSQTNSAFQETERNHTS